MYERSIVSVGLPQSNERKEQIRVLRLHAPHPLGVTVYVPDKMPVESKEWKQWMLDMKQGTVLRVSACGYTGTRALERKRAAKRELTGTKSQQKKPKPRKCGRCHLTTCTAGGFRGAKFCKNKPYDPKLSKSRREKVDESQAERGVTKKSRKKRYAEDEEDEEDEEDKNEEDEEEGEDGNEQEVDDEMNLD